MSQPFLGIRHSKCLSIGLDRCIRTLILKGLRASETSSVNKKTLLLASKSHENLFPCIYPSNHLGLGIFSISELGACLDYLEGLLQFLTPDILWWLLGWLFACSKAQGHGGVLVWLVPITLCTPSPAQKHLESLEELGAPGWLTWWNMRFLILGSWVGAPHWV